MVSAPFCSRSLSELLTPLFPHRALFFALIQLSFSQTMQILFKFLYIPTIEKDIATDLDKAVCLMEELRVRTRRTQTIISTLGPGSASTPFLMLFICPSQTKPHLQIVIFQVSDNFVLSLNTEQNNIMVLLLLINGFLHWYSNRNPVHKTQLCATWMVLK